MCRSPCTGWLLGLAVLCVCQRFAEAVNNTQYADAGSTVTLRCSGRRAPSAVVLWALDGHGRANRELLADVRHNFTQNGDLVIQNLQRADSGMYTCHANNTSNPMLSWIRLVVQDIELELRTGIVNLNRYVLHTDLKNGITVQAGSLVQFSGRLIPGRNGNQTADWTLNGSSHYLVRPFYCWSVWIEQNTALQLTLFSAHSIHSGRYTFRSGTLSKSVDITVTGTAPLPTKQYFTTVNAINIGACSSYVPPSPTPPPTSPPATTASQISSKEIATTRTRTTTAKVVAARTSSRPLTMEQRPSLSQPPQTGAAESTPQPVFHETAQVTSAANSTTSVVHLDKEKSDSQSFLKEMTTNYLWPVLAAIIVIFLLAVLIVVILKRRRRPKDVDNNPRLSKVCEYLPADPTKVPPQRNVSVVSGASTGNQSQISNPYNGLLRETPVSNSSLQGSSESSTPGLRPQSGRPNQHGAGLMLECSPTPPISRGNPPLETPPVNQVNTGIYCDTPPVNRSNGVLPAQQERPLGREPIRVPAVIALQKAAVGLGASPAICRTCASADERELDSDSDREEVSGVIVQSKDDSAAVFGITNHANRRRHRMPTGKLGKSLTIANELASSAPTNLNISHGETPKLLHQVRIADHTCPSDSGLGSSFAIASGSAATLVSQMSQAADASPRLPVAQEGFWASKQLEHQQLSEVTSNGLVYETPWNDYDSVSSDCTPEVSIRRKNTRRSRRRVNPNPRSPPAESPPPPLNNTLLELTTDL